MHVRALKIDIYLAGDTTRVWQVKNTRTIAICYSSHKVNKDDQKIVTNTDEQESLEK